MRNVLAYLGILPDVRAPETRSDGRVLELPGASAYVFATVDGVFEPFHELGREMRAGEPAGRIHVT